MEETGIEKMKNERERDVVPGIDHLRGMKELQEKIVNLGSWGHLRKYKFTWKSEKKNWKSEKREEEDTS